MLRISVTPFDARAPMPIRNLMLAFYIESTVLYTGKDKISIHQNSDSDEATSVVE
jgi:hypothetical protein